MSKHCLRVCSSTASQAELEPRSFPAWSYVVLAVTSRVFCSSSTNFFLFFFAFLSASSSCSLALLCRLSKSIVTCSSGISAKPSSPFSSSRNHSHVDELVTTSPRALAHFFIFARSSLYFSSSSPMKSSKRSCGDEPDMPIMARYLGSSCTTSAQSRHGVLIFTLPAAWSSLRTARKASRAFLSMRNLSLLFASSSFFSLSTVHSSQEVRASSFDSHLKVSSSLRMSCASRHRLLMVRSLWSS
mmetsp:Transcript_26599/g.58402  ORF Transcript_26599/g.58402 Transcript_26599/m.58402 type:complete len:243 (-) Transcript_26599:825-1553(-)